MEQLFDLDQLHKRQNRQRWLRLAFGGFAAVVIVVAGAALISSKHHVRNAAAASYTTSSAATMPSNPTPTGTAPPTSSTDNTTTPVPISAPAYTSPPPISYTPPAPPSAPTIAPNAWTSLQGVLTGTYYYTVSFVSSDGTETSLGPVSLSAMPKNQEVWLTNVPTSPSSSVNERKIYRTTAGGSMVGPFYLVTTLYDNITTNYYDNTPDSGLPTYAPKYR